jgi:hypothetical protein
MMVTLKRKPIRFQPIRRSQNRAAAFSFSSTLCSRPVDFGSIVDPSHSPFGGFGAGVPLISFLQRAFSILVLQDSA